MGLGRRYLLKIGEEACRPFGRTILPSSGYPQLASSTPFSLLSPVDLSPLGPPTIHCSPAVSVSHPALFLDVRLTQPPFYPSLPPCVPCSQAINPCHPALFLDTQLIQGLQERRERDSICNYQEASLVCKVLQSAHIPRHWLRNVRLPEEP